MRWDHRQWNAERIVVEAETFGNVQNGVLAQVHGGLGERGVTGLRKNPGEVGRVTLVTNTAAKVGNWGVGLGQIQFVWDAQRGVGRRSEERRVGAECRDRGVG